MTKPLSTDLRERLVSAVEGGMTRQSAAKRFGIATSTAIKWVDQWCRTGDVGPPARRGSSFAPARGPCRGNPGADRGHARHHLERAGGASGRDARGEGSSEHDLAAARPAWNDVQKKPRTPASNSGLTSCGNARPGSPPSRSWSRSAWSSSTRRELRPRWPADADGHRAASVAGHRYPMGTGRSLPSSAPCGPVA